MLMPLRDWLIVEPVMPSKEVTLAIPESAKDSWTTQEAMAFRVVSAGPGWWDGEQFHKNLGTVGDVVILEGKLSVNKITYAGRDYYVAQGRYVALVERQEEMCVGVGDVGVE